MEATETTGRHRRGPTEPGAGTAATPPMELVAIGVAVTPYATAAQCPRLPWAQPALARINLDEPYCVVADGIRVGMRLHVLWWAHRARRDVVRRRIAAHVIPSGVCASRGPDRPNPIGLTLVEVVAICGQNTAIDVRGLDCVTGTPILDLKPALVADSVPWQ